MAADQRPTLSRIGPYRIERVLGAGGMGEVVQAYDERLRRHVAIKRIRRPFQRDNERSLRERRRFLREAQAVARLSHPSIVQIHDLLEDESGDALVMELIDGRTVAEALRAGPLQLRDAIQLGIQVASGLAAAHHRGLIHRDLKAENVMIGADGSAKILDFGLVKWTEATVGDESLTGHGALLGTTRSMSPEQAAGRPVTPQSDLFSLGVLLYEMTSGRSPFHGTNALDTLRRVQFETPTPLREYRPATPTALADLIDALLAKHPADRPQEATEVVHRLETLAEEPGSSGVQAAETRELDHPAVSFGDRETGPISGQEPASAHRPPPSARGSTPRRRRLWPAIVGSVLATLLVFWFIGGEKPTPLRVALPEPEVHGETDDKELAFVATGAKIAALAALADLQGIAPIEPAELGGATGSPREIARAVAADEVVLIDIEPFAGEARLSIRRVDGDGTVRWVDAITVSVRRDSARLLADAMAVQLGRAFPRHPARDKTLRLEASNSDLAAFVEVSRRLDMGTFPVAPELETLEAILHGSPRFLTARLLAAGASLSLYSSRRRAADLERAAFHASTAREMAPNDPEGFELLIRIALAQGDPTAAQATLDELREAAPGSLEALTAESRIARHRGDLESAAEVLERVVARRPSWDDLYRLADVEYRRGRFAVARGHLDTLLERAPNNTWGLGKLVQLELLYGDLSRAEQLALRAIAVRPHSSYYGNLGLARYYLGDYRGALDSYRKALELDPDHLTVRLNVADAELALGNRQKAAEVCREILRGLGERELGPSERMSEAQCLAHLGETQRAAAVTLETLQQNPEHAEVAYQAALVYTLLGEPSSALVNVERALERGFQPRQFDIPSFEPLRSDPRFAQLIEASERP